MTLRERHGIFPLTILYIIPDYDPQFFLFKKKKFFNEAMMMMRSQDDQLITVFIYIFSSLKIRSAQLCSLGAAHRKLWELKAAS